jgi:glycosyltransferase involved in cell wall biosynthesis
MENISAVKSLGVYVPTRDDENLIGPCLQALVSRFPELVVLDIGSKDNTIREAKKFGVEIHKIGLISGKEYTELKCEYSKKHEWVFWIDSDEIYPEESLIKIERRLKDPDYEYSTINILWKVLKIRNGYIYETKSTEKLCGKGKLFKPSNHLYRRAWPREVLDCREHSQAECSKEPRGLNGLYCWHGVLLNRSSSIREDTLRRKKRIGKIAEYEQYDWIEIDELPWGSGNLELLKEPLPRG